MGLGWCECRARVYVPRGKGKCWERERNLSKAVVGAEARRAQPPRFCLSPALSLSLHPAPPLVAQAQLAHARASPSLLLTLIEQAWTAPPAFHRRRRHLSSRPSLHRTRPPSPSSRSRPPSGQQRRPRKLPPGGPHGRRPSRRRPWRPCEQLAGERLTPTRLVSFKGGRERVASLLAGASLTEQVHRRSAVLPVPGRREREGMRRRWHERAKLTTHIRFHFPLILFFLSSQSTRTSRAPARPTASRAATTPCSRPPWKPTGASPARRSTAPRNG